MQQINCAFFILSVILCLFLTRVSSAVEDKDVIVLSHVIYRHGDRAPVKPYKNDPYKNTTLWPEGFGQLTKKGKKMEYKLGAWLRQRYNGFINKTWLPDEVHIRSTDYDRTLMSAQCVLASFYYPDNATRFNESVAWMPTPVHTSASEDDVLINVDTSCPRISKELGRVALVPSVKKFIKKHKDLFKYLTKHSGEEITTVLDVDFLFDTLYIEQLYNLTLPDWTKGYMETMKEVADFSFSITTITPELKRLRAGPMLGEMTNNMMLKTNPGSLSKKLFMYSAHDTTIATILSGLGVFNHLSPPYASTILVELYKTPENDFYVKTFLRNNTKMTKDPYLLTLPGCKPKCPLRKWAELLNDSIPSDWSKECGRPDYLLQQYYIEALSATIACVVLLLLVLALGTYVIHKRRVGTSDQRDVEYQPIATQDDEP